MGSPSTDPVLRYFSPSHGRRLRISVVLPSTLVEAWVAGLLESLLSSPCFGVCDIVFDSQAGADSGGAPVDVGPTLTALGRVEGPADLAIVLGGQPRAHATAARLGAWTVHFGDPDEPCRPPAFFWEVHRGLPITTVAILRHDAAGCVAVLSRYSTATRQGWVYSDNAAEPCNVAAQLLLRQLLAAREYILGRGPEPAGTRIQAPALDERPPGIFDIAGFVFRQAARSVRLRAQFRGRTASWFIAVRSSGGTYSGLPAPPGRAYADPFLIERDRCHVLLLEDMPVAGGPARLCATELFPNGSYSPAVPILEPPYHVSYPCPVEHHGDLFLIPESSQNRTVDLYRCVRFPFEWKLERTLLSGIELVDTTPVQFEGRWYFFTTASGTSAETYLFTAPDLDGDWRLHPRSPICSDIRSARGGGAIYRREGKLIRPAQDCSKVYGGAVVLNQIDRLSPLEYEERPSEVIGPDWAPRLLGTHTVSRDSLYEVIDGLSLEPLAACRTQLRLLDTHQARAFGAAAE